MIARFTNVMLSVSEKVIRPRLPPPKKPPPPRPPPPPPPRKPPPPWRPAWASLPPCCDWAADAVPACCEVDGVEAPFAGDVAGADGLPSGLAGLPFGPAAPP